MKIVSIILFLFFGAIGVMAQEEQGKLAAKANSQEEAKQKAQEADALDAAKRLIEIPIDNYFLSQTDADSYQKYRLDEKIVLLKLYPDLRFYIYGYTCDEGNEEVSEYIGLRRAEKAKNYLISKGIDGKRIVNVSSKHDTNPVVPNTDEENRRKNRRVQLVIVQ